MCPDGWRRRFDISPATHTRPRPRSSASRSATASCVTERMRGAGPARSIPSLTVLALSAGDEGLEHLPALQQLERVVELRIRAQLAFLHLGRLGTRGRRLSGSRRRRGLPAVLSLFDALPLVLEVTRQVRLAQQRRIVALLGLRE